MTGGGYGHARLNAAFVFKERNVAELSLLGSGKKKKKLKNLISDFVFVKQEGKIDDK